MKAVLLGSLLAGALCLASVGAVAEHEPLGPGKEAVAMREAAIKSLLGFLDDDGVFKEKQLEAEQAVLLLGELRAAEAVPLLLEHVDFVPEGRFFRGLAPRDFPCVLALTKIGNPALDGLVELMAADEDSHWLCVWAVVKIDGAVAAQARVQAALAAEPDPERKQRLAEAEKSLRSCILNPAPAAFAD